MTADESDSNSGDARFRRDSDVVWRVTSDRVLVRRVAPFAGGDHDAELIGSAAFAWAAADEPSTVAEIAHATDLAMADVVAALADLVDARWMSAT